MEALRIFLFGNPRFEYHGQPVIIHRRKGIALLVYLALTGQPRNRDELATLLWPENDHTSARANLRRNLSRLRSLFGDDLLDVQWDTVGLKPDAGLWVDVAAFRAKLAVFHDLRRAAPPLSADAVAALADAAALYADHFMTGFSLLDSPAFDEWQFFQAESLRQELALALQQLVQWYSGCGAYVQALEYSRRLVALDALNEAAQRDLMLLYALAGQRAAALRQYEQCAQLLQQELGIDPEPETKALFESILSREVGPTESASPASAQVPPGASPPVRLPSEPVPFVGRARELGEIQQLFMQERPLMVTIVGPSGIGKTRLACAVAAAVAPWFRDGVYFVPLGAVASAERLIPVLADALDCRFHGESTPRGQLLAYLRDKRMLLVLDNFETVSAGVEFLRELQHVAPGVRMLLTAQERLNLSGEIVYPLGSMAVPVEDLSGVQPETDSLALLVESARLVRPGFELSQEQIADAVQICRLVHGMPLAIILAAGWLEMLSLKQVADEIAQSLDFLSTELRDMPERQSSVRAAFDYSWHRLAPEHQHALMRLSVFQGRFGHRAAETVAGIDLKTLRVLVNKSFVSANAEGLYVIHGLLRAYIAEKLETHGGAQATHDLHSNFFLDRCRQLTPALKGHRQIEALAEIEESLEDILAAWTWALAQGDLGGLSAALESLYLFYEMRSRFHEGAELFDAAQRHFAGSTDEDAQCLRRQILVRSIMLQTRFLHHAPELLDVLVETLDDARRCEDQAEYAFALLTMGYYLVDTAKDFAGALDYFRQSLRIYEGVGDEFYLARAYHRIGYCLLPLGGTLDFMTHTSQGLEIARRSGNKFDAAICLAGLGSIGLLSREYVNLTESYYVESAALANETGDRLPLAQAKVMLGFMYALQGDVSEGRQACLEGLAIARAVNFPVTIAFGLMVLSFLASLEGHSLAAVQLAEDCRAVPSNAVVHMLAGWATALARCAYGDVNAAWRSLIAAADFALAASASGAIGFLLGAAAPLVAARGDHERAVTYLAVASHFPQSLTGWIRIWPVTVELQATLQQRLGEARYHAAWNAAAGLEPEAVVAAFRRDAGLSLAPAELAGSAPNGHHVPAGHLSGGALSSAAENGTSPNR